MEDGQIVRLYFARDERAIAETAGKYSAYCHSIAYRILENHPDSEEVVNDTFLGAWNSNPPTKPISLPAYLGKISRRLALNKWRCGRTQKRGGRGSYPGTGGTGRLYLLGRFCGSGAGRKGTFGKRQPLCQGIGSDRSPDFRSAVLAFVFHPGDCTQVPFFREQSQIHAEPHPG